MGCFRCFELLKKFSTGEGTIVKRLVIQACDVNFTGFGTKKADTYVIGREEARSKVFIMYFSVIGVSQDVDTNRSERIFIT